jgi:hypothetical protein
VNFRSVSASALTRAVPLIGAAAVTSLAAGCSGHTARPAAGLASPTAVASPSHPGSGQAARTFLAEGQDIDGTVVHEPACGSGCALSGDGTTVLYDMTWSSWAADAATGSGTENLESCDPDCASGRQYRVRVIVTLSKPVEDCTASGQRWLWSEASFRYPAGLPAPLRGANAPLNPWVFTPLAQQAGQSCSGVS